MVRMVRRLFTPIKKNNEQNVTRYGTFNENYAATLGKGWLSPGQNEIKKVPIEDVPFMTTADGTVVCIPKLPEMGLTATIGMTGYGKTLTSGYILDNIFWLWKDNVAVMNDSQEETFDWSQPCDSAPFKVRLKIVGQGPYPLPMIYVLPSSDNPEEKEDVLHKRNYINCSIPFEEVISNIELYIPDLGASLKYVLEKKEQLLEARSEEELFEVISSIDTKTKGMAESVHKITISFKTLINEGILKLSDPSVPSYITVKKEGQEIYSGNPFTAIMKANCIPSFITSNLYTQRYKDAIFFYYLDQLFQESLSGKMKGKRTWVYFDELTRVVHSDPRLSSTETEKALNNIASRGRNNGISLIYATQRYNEIPRSIRSQTKYAIVFRHKQRDETKMICDDFSLDNRARDDILKLKKFEAIAATTEFFVCYKADRKWEETGPIKGTIIPPMHRNRFLHKK